ncbi:MAG TPA: hypothetical protein VH682_10110 [Gemmataceae bacterium]|jgi:hypothetical protein
MSAIEVEKVQRADSSARETGTVVEIPLLLESWLLAELESAARTSGMTTGTMVRRLIREFLYYSDGDPPAP